MAATSRDEFVDLYDVMDLPVDSDSETIRLRLNALYLEAQQNLDHRNAKKRLQYQQMYEIYLPQGRHLLLDPRRRAEYDLYLNAYRTGNKVAPAVAPVEESAYSPGEISKVEEPPIPGMAEVQVDPEVLAAEREDMWAKWKVGLESAESVAEGSESEGSESVSAMETQAPSVVAQATATATAPTARPTPPTPRGYTAPTPRPRTAPGAPTPRSARPAPRQPGFAGQNAQNFEAPHKPDASGDMDKQREQQRYALIKDAVQNAGLMGGAIYGGGIFFVGLIILFVSDNALKPRYPLGLTQTTFALMGFLIILAAAAFGGFAARRQAKRRAVAQFSVLSTEELMRRSRS